MYQSSCLQILMIIFSCQHSRTYMAADRVMPPIAGENRKDMEGLCLVRQLSYTINK
jgi:hypothetical protein